MMWGVESTNKGVEGGFGTFGAYEGYFGQECLEEGGRVNLGGEGIEKGS